MPIGSVIEVNYFCRGLSEQGIARKIINMLRKKSEGIVIKTFFENKNEIFVSFECLEGSRKIQEIYRKLKRDFQNMTTLAT